MIKLKIKEHSYMGVDVFIYKVGKRYVVYSKITDITHLPWLLDPIYESDTPLHLSKENYRWYSDYEAAQDAFTRQIEGN